VKLNIPLTQGENHGNLQGDKSCRAAGTVGSCGRSGAAETLATNRAATAVVAALTPICIDRFRQAADASANLVEMKKATYAWDQSKFVEKGGWATMPGSSKPNSAVAKACAESLGSKKAVELGG